MQRYVNKGSIGVNNTILGDWTSATGAGLGFICRDVHGDVRGLDVLQSHVAELESEQAAYYLAEHHGELLAVGGPGHVCWLGDGELLEGGAVAGVV